MALVARLMRCHNFSAGPAALPTPVLETAQQEMLEWGQSGSSVMEVSHRGAPFTEMAHGVETDVRSLLGVGEDYAVLFMHGGATGQFAAVPLNLLGSEGCADYLNSGHWAARAIYEAKRYCTPQIVAGACERDGMLCMPAPEEWHVDDDAAYFHYTANETIDGLEFKTIPDVHATLVADYSSTILSQPLDITRFGLVYAGAQKNIGPAGLAMVIVRKDLLERATQTTPSVLHYAEALKHESMYNTPPTFAWYMTGLVFKWLRSEGGLDVIAQRNKRKAEKLYRTIDNEPFYHNKVAPAWRSQMNVPFSLARPELDKQFLSQAEDAGLLGLKGHRSVGGMRASIYNAISEASVDALIAFMCDFAKRNG